MTNEELKLVLTEEFPDAEVKQGSQYVEMTVTRLQHCLNKQKKSHLTIFSA